MSPFPCAPRSILRRNRTDTQGHRGNHATHRKAGQSTQGRGVGRTGWADGHYSGPQHAGAHTPKGGLSRGCSGEASTCMTGWGTEAEGGGVLPASRSRQVQCTLGFSWGGVTFVKAFPTEGASLAAGVFAVCAPPWAKRGCRNQMPVMLWVGLAMSNGTVVAWEWGGGSREGASAETTAWDVCGSGMQLCLPGSSRRP